MKTLSALTYNKRKRLQKRQRLAKVLVFLSAWCLIIILAVSQGSIARGENQSLQTVVVSGGDTLWTLAQEHAPADQDLRSYIARIRELNHLSHPVIYPGQILELP
ncbi:MAG: LysM peptidoglycan-binding domain-containing protein [Firmicutes bacterium]|mgnify:CR=1 FL=1|nr:LysM peptidoglycan-binding domain-containing protein [Bacillota bacterium]